ncbi:TadE/TadG family type IV pilus assembly protein [Ramlibacter algicola]|uniref:Pilus assembly protein n=1 Tax=Ramlibacter algicola TaxID=2795217 RepID=A0A934Q0L1_9BURK|nr:TadE/TadG family type IV pilus assembly protein [Ramlibacter algicola]MBK0394010.1 pilus assembly protein [Ramlibacter algicola]
MKIRQHGATAVEFALVLIAFLAVMLAILDFARMMFAWSSASEATRAGARYAAVCGNTGNAPAVVARMQALVPQITTANVAWDPPGCSPTTCVGVRVSVTGMNYNFMSPIAGLARVGAIPMPDFATYLTREDMRQDPNADTYCP